MMGKAKIEWNYVIMFLIGVGAWLFIGLPWLSNAVNIYGIVWPYLAFLAGYVALFYFIDRKLRSAKLTMFAILVMSSFLIWDILAPPMLVPLGGETALAPEQSLASDVFFYAIFTGMGFAHFAAWGLTYIGVPLAIFLLIIYKYNGKKLKNMLTRG